MIRTMQFAVVFLFWIAPCLATADLATGAATFESEVTPPGLANFIRSAQLGKPFVFEGEQELADSPIVGSAANKSYESTYVNGDAQYLIGDLSRDMGKEEWRRYFTLARWLAAHYFRPIINPVAGISDLRAAVQDPRTSLIIWSGHGSRDGTLWSAWNNSLPLDVFTDQAGSRFKFLVLSSCHGDQAVKKYTMPAHVRYWTGVTDAKEFFDYLISNEFNRDLEKNLGIQL